MQRGTLGAQYLNTQLQQALNPAQLGVAEYTRGQKTLRCRDRVIQTVNNYDKDVFNGDIGYILHIDAEEKEVHRRLSGARGEIYLRGIGRTAARLRAHRA